MEKAIQDRTDRLRIGGGGVCLLHLAEDLRLADDQRVEAAGDPEQVPRRVEAADVVQVRRQIRGLHAVKLREKRHQIGARRRRIVAGHVQLGAVAGRDNDRFARGPASRHRPQRVGHAAHLEVHALAQVDRRSAVADSDQKQIHEPR
jgi:hypothetical protein